MARQLDFGTDGVRGVVGETSHELVERLGKAATLWSGRGRVFVGRDTRGFGPGARGGVRTRRRRGGRASRCSPASCRPRPSRCSRSTSASSSPPRTTRRSTTASSSSTAPGHKLTDESEEEIEALLDATGPGGGTVEPRRHRHRQLLEHVVEHFGTDLSGLRIAVDCANGAYSDDRAEAFERLGAEVTAIASRARRRRTSTTGCGATDLALLQEAVARRRPTTSASRSTATATGCWPSTETGTCVDGDQILAILALAPRRRTSSPSR